jgi:hypothetical protein
MVFWIAWGLDVVVALVALYAVFGGIAGGRFGLDSSPYWLALLLGAAIILVGSQLARLSGLNGLATFITLILAVPAVLYLFFLLVVVVSGETWN